MSWLGRLLGGGTKGPQGPAPLPASAVLLPDDLVTVLTAGGEPLQGAAVAALREALDARRLRAERAAASPEDDERVPFWLARETEVDAAIEDRLRDRLEHRRAAEEAVKEGD
jgi:hypothetical protein